MLINISPEHWQKQKLTANDTDYKMGRYQALWWQALLDNC